MKDPTNFDLEKAIATWRHQFKHGRLFRKADVDELERHVRDHVQFLIDHGASDEDAFRKTVAELGSFYETELEYRKIFWAKLRENHGVAPELIWNLSMFKNYLKIFSRNLIKYHGFSFINILSLALGLASFAFISIYVTHEKGFDKFHDGSDRLYRINKVVTTSTGVTQRHALTAGLLGPAIMESFPEVEQVVRLQPWFDDVLLAHENRFSLTPDVIIADSNFFEVFGFDLVRGDPQEVLIAPMSIVITELTADLLFGDTDPVGQIVQGINNLDFTVTGVAANPRLDSHLRFDALISWTSTLPGGGGLELEFLHRWITQAPFTYVRLAPNTSATSFEAKLPDFYALKDPERAKRYTLFLQPAEDIYLTSANLMHTGNTRNGNQTYVATFSVIAFLILTIAAINFINLSTARGAARAKEVGVRKVFGAHRSQISHQLLTESVLYSLLAFVLALGLIQLALPTFVNFTGLSVTAKFGIGSSLLMLLGGVAVVLGLVSGIFPATVLSRFRPASSLRGAATGKGLMVLRNIFVTFQFAISMVLVAASFVVLRQLEFIQSTDLGFVQDQQVVMTTDDTDIQEHFEAFR